jgi:hypothetical protein
MSNNQSNPTPPLSPDAEAHMEMLARFLLDIIRDYRDGKLNLEAQTNKAEQTVASSRAKGVDAQHGVPN